MYIPPVKASTCENYLHKFAHEKIVPYGNSPLRKSPPPMKIPSPLINHTNERKNKNTKFFALKKVLQHNILMKIAKVLFDTQMIS